MFYWLSALAGPLCKYERVPEFTFGEDSVECGNQQQGTMSGGAAGMVSGDKIVESDIKLCFDHTGKTVHATSSLW